MFTLTGIAVSAVVHFSAPLPNHATPVVVEDEAAYYFTSNSVGEGGPKGDEGGIPAKAKAESKGKEEGKMDRHIRYEGGEDARRKEIVSDRGKRYVDCELIEADDHGLTFRHRGGVAKLGYRDMGKAMQDEYGYDPEVEKSERRERVEKRREQWNRETAARRAYAYGNAYGNGNGQGYGYAYGYGTTYPPLGIYAYTSQPGSTNPAFSTNTLRQIVDYRNNGWSNISISEQLYNQHFRIHSGNVYHGNALRPAVIAAPPYLPYVRNIYPRQIGTFSSGPSGGSLVPTLRSGYSQAGAIAPSLAPSPRR